MTEHPNQEAQQTYAQLSRADNLNDLRRYDQAAQLLAGVLANAPNNGAAWCEMARSQLGLKNHAAALDAASRGAGLVPDWSWPPLLASWACSGLGREEDAANWAEEAIRRDPRNARTHARYAHALLDMGNPGRAQLAAGHALELDPNDPNGHVLFADIARYYSRYDTADRHYHLALAIDPQHANAHAGLAELAIARNRALDGRGLAVAADSLATAVRVDPKDPEVRAQLDVVLHATLARFSWLFLAGVWLSRHVVMLSSGPVRWLLLALLPAIPGFFTYRYLRHLSPHLRAHVYALATGRRVLPPVLLMALSLFLVVAAAADLLPQDSPALGVALLLAFAARMQLEFESSSARRRANPDLPYRIPSWVLAILAGVLYLGAGVYLQIALTEPNDRGEMLTAAGVVFALAAIPGLMLWSRVENKPQWYQRISKTDLLPAACAAVVAVGLLGWLVVSVA